MRDRVESGWIKGMESCADRVQYRVVTAGNGYSHFSRYLRCTGSDQVDIASFRLHGYSVETSTDGTAHHSLELMLDLVA